MPWGWECRAKLIKQLPSKPTERRGPVCGEMQAPAPNHYEAPQIFCGNGYSKIKRAPAYTFGHMTKSSFAKPAAVPNAPMLNLQGLRRDGLYKIPNGVVTPHIEPVVDKLKVPGPGTYAPRTMQVRYKRPPAYTVKPPAKPPYQPWDMWTPSPNMYCPPIPCKKEPAYTLGYTARDLKAPELPGPGEYDPNFHYVVQKKPSYSIGAPFKRIKPPKTPPPNIYCEKKFMVSKRTNPAPSFGIKHSPYIPERPAHLKPVNLDILASDG